MQINRREFGKLIGFATLMSSVSGLSLVAQAKPVVGGEASFYTQEPPVLYNIDRNGTENISNKIVEGLLEHDLDLKPIPALATSWEINPEQTRFVFHLREGVKWHDGKPFTSADVAYSVKTQAQLHPRRRATFADLVEVETPDPLTAIFVFSAPAPFLLGALNVSGTQIVPRHLFEGKGVPTNPAQQNPIGTGPFRFVEWQKGSHVVLERNPDYWGKPAPYLENVFIRFIPDAAARVAAFETGELDMGESNAVPVSEVPRLEKLPTISIINRKVSQKGHASQFFFNLATPQFADRKVREAFAHAVDPNVIVRDVYKGRARLAPTIIGPNLSEFHDPSIKPYAYDPDLANRLLDEAGLKRGAYGKRFKVRITYNPWTDQTRLMSGYLRSAFDAIGVEGEINAYDYTTYIKKVYTERAFDIDVQTYANGYDPTDGVQRGYWSKNIKIGLPWSNTSHYKNDEADRLFEAAAREPDPAKRRQLYFQVQKIVYDDLPSVGLVAPDDFIIHTSRLKGSITQSLSMAGLYVDEG